MGLGHGHGGGSCAPLEISKNLAAMKVKKNDKKIIHMTKHEKSDQFQVSKLPDKRYAFPILGESLAK